MTMVIPGPEQDETQLESAGTPGGDRQSESGARTAAGTLHSWVKHAPAERAPVLAIPGIWTAAQIMHMTGMSPLIAGTGTVAAAGLAFGIGERRQRRQEVFAQDLELEERGQDEDATGAGEQPGDDVVVPAAYRQPHPRLRGAELAAATLGTGTWVTLAVHWGAAGGPDHITGLLYLGGAVGGYCWLRTHEAVRAARARRDAAALEAAERDRRNAEWQAKRAAWHRLAGLIGIPNGHRSHLMEWNKTPLGETWLVKTIGTGQRASALVNEGLAERIAELGGSLDGTGSPLPPGRVAVSRGHVAGHIRITVRTVREPWAAPIMHPMASGVFNPAAPYADLLPVAPTAATPICVGVDPEHGTPMLLPLLEAAGAQHAMVVGTTGSGKTNLLDTCRVHMTLCPDMVWWQINLRKPRSERHWTGVAEGSALAGDEGCEARALAILQFLTGLISVRTGGSGRSHRPTPKEPLHAVVIDEIKKCAEDPARREEINAIVSAGRECGVVLLEAGQRPVQQDVGGMAVRANVNYYVYGRMIATDKRLGFGSEEVELPDMGSYGEGAAGVFGIARMNAGTAARAGQGRTWFWGDDNTGLDALIASLAKTHVPYQPEPAVAASPRLMELWTAATGGALPSGDEFDLTSTASGTTVPGVASAQAKLDQTARLMQSMTGRTLPPRPAVTAPAAPPLPRGTDDGGRDVLEPGQMLQLWQMLMEPGGTTSRRAEQDLGCSHTTVWKQLGILRDRRQAEMRGAGAGAYWEATTAGRQAATQLAHDLGRARLRIVPDPAAQAETAATTQTAVSDATVPPQTQAQVPDSISGPGEVPLSRDDVILIAAIWGLAFGSPQAGVDLSRVARHARERGLPEDIVTEAVQLLRSHRPYVVTEGIRTAAEAGAGLPPWLARWRPLTAPDEDTDPDEDLEEDPEEGLGELEDGGELDGPGPAGSVSP